MRKFVYTVGAIALIAAAVLTWSKHVVLGPQAVRASAIGTAENDRASDATPRISPLEMMEKHGKNLPVEYWSHPF